MDFEDEIFLNKKLSERVNREIEILDDVFAGELFFEDQEQEVIPEMPKARGRPKGVKESAPRKAKINVLESILIRIEEAFIRLNRLEEIIKKTGPHEYTLYSKKKDAKTGQRKTLGKFASRKQALKREKQIQHFKSKK